MANPQPIRPFRAIALVIALAALSATTSVALPANASARAPAGWQVVRYAGARFLAPEGWAVVRLDTHPTACLRLDVHAVYLGTQGPRARCSGSAAGRTDTIEVTRLRTAPSGPRTYLGPQPVVITPTAPIERSIRIAFPRLGVVVSATFGNRPAVVRRIIGSFALGNVAVADPPALPRGAAVPAAGVPTGASVRASSTAERATVSAFVGRGFDACTAPPLTSMRAWRASPFRAIGIYVGGANRACSQVELTASWVASVEAMGWNLEPLYVGLQAPCARQHGMTPVRADRATSQGVASADDAVAQAGSLGLGVGTPIYFDMEGYDITRAPCVRTVNAFLDAWTTRLHQHGYVAGVYGGASSTISALVSAEDRPGFAEPDDIWFANWDGRARVYDDPYFTNGMWTAHQRIHQFLGGHVERWGGVPINVDSSQVDGAVVGEPAEGSFVRTVRGAMYRVAGGAPMPVHDCTALGGCRPIETLASVGRFPRYPANGTVLRSAGPGQDYVVAGGAALPVADCSATLPRCAAPVTLEQPTISGGADGHLRAMPPAGTLVRGVPSGIASVVRYGCIDPPSAGQQVSGAARVPDADLASLFPTCSGTLAFARNVGGSRRITIQRADGAGRRTLSGSGDDLAPALSPDGTQIAFTGRRGGNADLWVMNVNGSGLRRLTRLRAFDGFPSWSPDGRSLAFESDRGGSLDIWTIGVAGGALHQLTFARGMDGFPSWSPDGRSLAFESDRGGSLDIWTIGVAGGALRRLTSAKGTDGRPAWSPDGTRIAFSSTRDGTADIWTIGPFGGALHRVTSLSGNETAPAWSPDGLRLAFATDAGGGGIDVVRADGWGVTPFPSGIAGDPAWG